MRDTQPTKRQPTKKFLEIAMRTKSWQPVARNGWVVKFSVYRNTNVLLTIISQCTGQVIMRHFNDEDDACMFINLIVELNAEDTYEL